MTHYSSLSRQAECAWRTLVGGIDPGGALFWFVLRALGRPGGPTVRCAPPGLLRVSRNVQAHQTPISQLRSSLCPLSVFGACLSLALVLDRLSSSPLHRPCWRRRLACDSFFQHLRHFLSIVPRCWNPASSN
jgi:hypothetical protein